MKKKCRVAVIVALIISFISCPLGIAAADNPADTKTDIESMENVKKGTSSNASPKELSDTVPKTKVGTPSNAVSETEGTGNLSLQIPQKLQVIIDPLDLDEKGQIYSEQYIIQNKGETTGTLTLSFTCRPKNNSNLRICQENDGIHHGEGKSIFMEIVFQNTDRMILSQEKSEYQAKLEPGEEVSLYFTGEVNEYAAKPWKDNDIAIEGIYKWDDSEEELMDEDEEMEEEDSVSEIEDETEKNSPVSESDLVENPLDSGKEQTESPSVSEGNFIDKDSSEEQGKNSGNQTTLEEEKPQEELEEQKQTSGDEGIAEEKKPEVPIEEEKREEGSDCGNDTEEKNLQESVKDEGEQQEETSGNEGKGNIEEEIIQDASQDTSEKGKESSEDKDTSEKDVPLDSAKETEEISGGADDSEKKHPQDTAEKQEENAENKELSEKENAKDLGEIKDIEGTLREDDASGKEIRREDKTLKSEEKENKISDENDFMEESSKDKE